jgi:hypothetical protein
METQVTTIAPLAPGAGGESWQYQLCDAPQSANSSEALYLALLAPAIVDALECVLTLQGKRVNRLGSGLFYISRPVAKFKHVFDRLARSWETRGRFMLIRESEMQPHGLIFVTKFTPGFGLDVYFYGKVYCPNFQVTYRYPHLIISGEEDCDYGY